MKTVETQMKIADEILAKLETFDPTCILAGGAPRDWYFGNLATDLDFFVYWHPDYQPWRYEEQLKKLGFKAFAKTGETLPENYKRNPNLITVYEFQYKGETAQVMFMSDSTFRCVVSKFPFGICQAWYKTGYGVRTSNEFDVSVKHKVLRLLNDLYNDADGYIEKIRNKFPDYLYIGKGE